MESQVRSLKALGVSSDSYGSLLSSVLMKKLPQELRLVVSREVTDGEFNLDKLMAIVEREIDARERASTASSSISSLRRQNRDVPTTFAMLANATSLKYCYCGQTHSSDACESVINPEDRKRILMKTGRCFVCLRKFRRSRDCRSTMRCSHCNGRHHVSLCMKNQPSGSGNLSTGRRVSSLSSPSPNTDSSKSSSTTPVSLINFISAKVPVLLQTAKAHIYKVTNPDSVMEVRVLFDSGSQRSYVTERVKAHLSLDTDHVETMLIKTFGSDKENRQECSVVKLGLMLKDGASIEMSLFTVPLICEPLSVQPISYTRERYSHLSDLDVADSVDGDRDMEVDILIGSDYHWRLVLGEVVQGDEGPAAIRTRLGWVLSGPVEGSPQESSAVNLVSTHS